MSNLELRLEAQRWIDRHPPDRTAGEDETGHLIWKMMQQLEHEQERSEKQAAELDEARTITDRVEAVLGQTQQARDHHASRCGELLAAIVEHRRKVRKACFNGESDPLDDDAVLWAVLRDENPVPPIIIEGNPGSDVPEWFREAWRGFEQTEEYQRNYGGKRAQRKPANPETLEEIGDLMAQQDRGILLDEIRKEMINISTVLREIREGIRDLDGYVIRPAQREDG